VKAARHRRRPGRLDDNDDDDNDDDNDTERGAMRTHARWAAAAALALGGGGLAAGLELGAAGGPALPTRVISLAAATLSPAGADQAALAYVDARFPGSRPAQVLRTEADVEHGVPVYDVRVLAPDGTVIVVHVDRSSGTVISAAPAEHQLAVTATAPPVQSSPTGGAPSGPSRTAPAPGTPNAVPNPAATAPAAATPETEPAEREGSADAADHPDTGGSVGSARSDG
jgi:uncharacterized membrane protein YkoI